MLVHFLGIQGRHSGPSRHTVTSACTPEEPTWSRSLYWELNWLQLGTELATTCPVVTLFPWLPGADLPRACWKRGVRQGFNPTVSRLLECLLSVGEPQKTFLHTALAESAIFLYLGNYRLGPVQLKAAFFLWGCKTSVSAESSLA